MITKLTKIPTNSMLKKDEKSFGYVDCFRSSITTKEQNVDIINVLGLFLQGGSKWIDQLLNIRDKIVKPFGLKTSAEKGSIQQLTVNANYEPGTQLGIFKLIDHSANEFVLGENDKHLNFRVSLLLEQSENKVDEMGLSITTVVKFNNALGRIYFIPVKPIHQLIVRTTLKDIVRELEHQKKQKLGR